MTLQRKINNKGTTTPTEDTSPSVNVITRQTRKSTLTQEDIEVLPSTIKNKENAEEYLTKNLLCHIDEPFTLTHLISVLFHITQLKSVPLPAIEAIRAVAYILKKHEANEIAETITNQITNNLSPRIAEHVIAAIAPQVAKILSTSESMDTTLKDVERLRTSLEREKEERRGETTTAAERFEEAVDALHESMEECSKTMTSIKPNLNKTQERIDELSLQLTSNPIQNDTNTPPPNQQQQQQQMQYPTYSSVTAANLPPSVDKAVARAALRARQIILDPLPGGNVFTPDTTHSDVVKLLKEALTNIRDDSSLQGNIESVTTFRNGGLLVEMDNEELATWIRKPFNSKALTSKLGPTVSFRSSAFPIIVEYLPIRIQIEDENFLRTMEKDNDLPENSLISIKWIKPITRHTQAQSKAFAIMQAIDAPMANNIIKEGICIQNERFTIRKDKKEPMRCAKCQSFGHIARNCKATSDTCGTCGDQHQTSACHALKSKFCTNCNNDQHTSWSRKCPEFKRRLEILNNSFPENRMPYYPTQIPWTQVANPPPPPPPPRARTPMPPQNTQSKFSTRPLTRFTQTTLDHQQHPPRRCSYIPQTQEPTTNNRFSQLPMEESNEMNDSSGWDA